jgi:hypothetical protein
MASLPNPIERSSTIWVDGRKEWRSMLYRAIVHDPAESAGHEAGSKGDCHEQ